ncbi:MULTISPECIES: hypothetical protein [unclassified Methanoregula]|uniref:hypothetical protein n=1 Tax=unclassified Methanoregula TaxID=2649730 RepID=UPI0009C91E69|nr:MULTISPECIES: hypothetical protein [unclassified Methanoregula]OPX62878.1 MAG: hypothetical protein A4E33_02007 [Methanoregula sp. PtaB.Bin085]
MTPEQNLLHSHDTKSVIRIAVSLVIGAIGFGYTGIFWGEGIHPLGDSIIFLPFNFWYIVAIWGIILGILTLDWKTAIVLLLLGLVAGIASIIVGNLGGLVFLAVIFGWFQLISYPLLPLFFLYCGYLFHKAGKPIHMTVLFILFISGAIDWVLMTVTFLFHDNYRQFDILFHAPLFGNALLFAGIGLLIGAIMGYGIKKIETMALFGMIGLTLGSYWMSVYSDPYAYMTSANDILMYSRMAATMGVFMVAGLFWPEKEIPSGAVIPPADEIPEKRCLVET